MGDWFAAFREFGFPAVVSGTLLWIMTFKLEALKDQIGDAQKAIQDDITQLRIEMARTGHVGAGEGGGKADERKRG